MIDLKNLDKLDPEERAQFDALLANFPQLQPKEGNKLNTPTKMELDPYNKLSYENLESRPTAPATAPATAPTQEDELDYASFAVPKSEPLVRNKEDLPQLKISDGSSVPTKSFDATSTEVKKEEVQPRQDNTRKPKQSNLFSPEGKTHPVLQKMRAALGSKIAVKPIDVSLGGCVYSLQVLDRSSMAQATVLATAATSDPSLYDVNLETALIAFALVAIDNVPLVDIFDIPTHRDDTFIHKRERETLAAQAMFSELLASPNELVEGLGVYYQQYYPMLSLLEEGKSKFMCPEPHCMQFRIAELSSDNYCPLHGQKMTSEEDLPNPF